jgi:hypothetical protein
MHPRGRHKARVFHQALGIGPSDAPWLREVLLDGVRSQEAVPLDADNFGSRWQVDLPIARHGKSAVIRTIWITRAGESAPRFAVMADDQRASERPSALDVVALLADLPAKGLARGHVGTVIESLDEATVLVEFSDEEGRAYALAPCSRSELLVLHYVPQAA